MSNTSEPTKSTLTDGELLALLFNERANQLIEQLVPDLQQRLLDKERRKVITQNVRILMVINEVPTVQKLANKAGIDRAQMSHFLKGKGAAGGETGQGLSAKKFCSLAHALAVNPVQLVTIDLQTMVREALRKP